MLIVKYIYFYSCNSIVPKKNRVLLCCMNITAYAWFTGRTIFEFLGFFFKFSKWHYM